MEKLDGILILETSVYPSWDAREYRIGYCIDVQKMMKNKSVFTKTFRDSVVFDSLEDASFEARKLERRHKRTHYGIMVVNQFKKAIWEKLIEGCDDNRDLHAK
jgi:hypothetical protein